MNKFFNIVAAMVITFGVSACAQPGTDYNRGPGTFGLNKTTGGGVLGAIGGGVLGSQFGKGSGNLAMTAVGTLLGAFIGSEVGASLDRADVAYAQQANHNALERAPVGKTVSWQNPESGNQGYVTPTRTFQTQNGQYCREFQQEIVVNGQSQRAFGVACRMQDGSWKIQN